MTKIMPYLFLNFFIQSLGQSSNPPSNQLISSSLLESKSSPSRILYQTFLIQQETNEKFQSEGKTQSLTGKSTSKNLIFSRSTETKNHLESYEGDLMRSEFLNDDKFLKYMKVCVIDQGFEGFKEIRVELFDQYDERWTDWASLSIISEVSFEGDENTTSLVGFAMFYVKSLDDDEFLFKILVESYTDDMATAQDSSVGDDNIRFTSHSQNFPLYIFIILISSLILSLLLNILSALYQNNLFAKLFSIPKSNNDKLLNLSKLFSPQLTTFMVVNSLYELRILEITKEEYTMNDLLIIIISVISGQIVTISLAIAYRFLSNSKAFNLKLLFLSIFWLGSSILVYLIVEYNEEFNLKCTVSYLISAFIQLVIDKFSYNLLFQEEKSVNGLDEKLILVEIQNKEENNLVANEEVANRVVSKTVYGLTPANDENEDRGFYRMSTYFGIKKKQGANRGMGRERISDLLMNRGSYKSLYL